MNKQEVFDSINYEAALAAPRCAGGHTEVMHSLFKDSAIIIAEYTEEDYQGEIAFAYQFPDGTVCIITDYYGSCSVCDAWDGASDEDVKYLIKSMVSSSRVFRNRAEAVEYCGVECQKPFEYSHHVAVNLLEQLKES